MPPDMLDEIDAGILHSLQENARNKSAAEIAEAVGVTANTVRNRIRRLEERGVIEGYVPLIDYEQADFQIKAVIVCTAPIPERKHLARKAVDVAGVTHVRELMTGHRNVLVTAVAAESKSLTDVASRLHNIGLTIEEEELVKNDTHRPFSHFGDDSGTE